VTIRLPQTLPAHLCRYAGGDYWANRTLGDCARERAEQEPDTVAFLGDPAAPTYAGLLADGEALARALLDLGLRPGDIISFQTPNWIEAAVINLAASLGGFVINPIVHIYRDAEVQQMLGDCLARAFFVAETFRSIDYAAMIERIRPDLPGLEHVVFVRPGDGAGGFAQLVEHGRKLTHALPKVDPDSVKLLLYTSGTTGRPKAVLHSHNTLARVANVTFDHARVTGQDITLMPSPVTHISGYSGGLEKPFQVGSRTVLMEYWDAAAAVELIDRYQVTSTVAATPFLMELCDAARLRGRTLPRLQRFACGGAAVPAELVRTANAALANPCAYRVYGSSEVPLATQGFLPDNLPALAADTDGYAVDYELRIVDEEDRDLPAGQDGEVLARGPSMFMGYADPQQTAEAITADGYFRSGDIGHLTPQGALVITGRKKDLIIRGGENISAKEIEDVLHTHPGVREAGVVSMPHARLGEGVCAYIIASGDAEVDAQSLTSHVLGSGIARQKCPERFEFVEDFPRTASGKVRKDQLREAIRRKLASA
jgi:acyl-CoA synthetase (AMP-forming)/AMP-acid ligase II